MADIELKASLDTTSVNTGIKGMSSAHAGMTKGMIADMGRLELAEKRLAMQQEKTRTAMAATAARTRSGDVRGGFGGSRNRNYIVGQGAMQAQDIAVQMQMGTKMSTIIAQQGSQLASLFGPKGMIIGGIVAIGAALISWATGTEKATEKQTEFQKVLEDNKKLAQEIAELVGKGAVEHERNKKPRASGLALGGISDPESISGQMQKNMEREAVLKGIVDSGADRETRDKAWADYRKLWDQQDDDERQKWKEENLKRFKEKEKEDKVSRVESLQGVNEYISGQFGFLNSVKGVENFAVKRMQDYEEKHQAGIVERHQTKREKLMSGFAKIAEAQEIAKETQTQFTRQNLQEGTRRRLMSPAERHAEDKSNRRVERALGSEINKKIREEERAGKNFTKEERKNRFDELKKIAKGENDVKIDADSIDKLKLAIEELLAK